ncbi:MAG TPA: M28 family metallopeptidase [Pyrinomonadaceae bacterium]|jgi:Zn-dependent M28 family amino/carboxypeptidase|nr:M28 family metallopeptidase [Pyrinomonadaceae bacterium]
MTKKRFAALLLTAAVLTLAAACAAPAPNNQTAQTPTPPAAPTPNYPAELRPALDSVTADDILRHTKVLASDEFEGRGPGTRGEELTVKYLTEQFQKLGLKPGNPDGTYTQKVPLAGFRAQPQMSVTAGDRQLSYNFPDDYVAVSRRLVPETKIDNSEVVFVGYGVTAPEFGWDDYKGVDVKGKTVVMFVNDPPVPDPSDPSKLDPKIFGGKAMTYYGRWTYKYEEASRHGAAAALIVHEEGPAGYPYEVVKTSRSQENFDIQTPDKNMNFVGVEGWLTLDKAKELFSASGQDFDALKKSALSRDFKPVTLGARANINLKNALRNIDSQNVVAKVEGSDPKLKDEYVVYSAHWDHLGRNESAEGDQIYNGAVDNASGVAQLLELAEAFAKLQPAPKRSVLFLAVTAEEKNLLGAKFYATNPLYPLERTLANINIDGANQWGRTRDVVIIGDGNSTLDDVAREVAAMQGRVVTPDPESDKGFYYRSDHFEFAKVGVPALYPDTGAEYVGKSPEFARQKRDEYTKNDYHKPSDEVKPDWDFSGAVDDAQLLFLVGHRVAQGDRFPEWKPGTEFKQKRDEMMKKAGAAAGAS